MSKIGIFTMTYVLNGSFIHSLYTKNKSFGPYEAYFFNRALEWYARPKVEPRPFYRGRYRGEVIDNIVLGLGARGSSILPKQKSSKGRGVNSSTIFVSVAQIRI